MNTTKITYYKLNRFKVKDFILEDILYSICKHYNVKITRKRKYEIMNFLENEVKYSPKTLKGGQVVGTRNFLLGKTKNIFISEILNHCSLIELTCNKDIYINDDLTLKDLKLLITEDKVLCVDIFTNGVYIPSKITNFYNFYLNKMVINNYTISINLKRKGGEDHTGILIERDNKVVFINEYKSYFLTKEMYKDILNIINKKDDVFITDSEIKFEKMNMVETDRFFLNSY